MKITSGIFLRRLIKKVIDLPAYAARLNIQLLKEADFNSRLRDRGCKVTVQKICRVGGDEREVRWMLEAIWENPKNSQKVLDEAMEKNKALYQFEMILEEGK